MSMTLVCLQDEIKRQAFVKEAAAFFSKHPEKWTYSHESPAPGCLFAERWGADNDCVAVFKLDENFEPLIYQQIIKKEPI
jgi:hypothetical protein